MRPDKSVCLIVLGLGGTTSIASFAQRLSQSLAEYDYKAILIGADSHDAGHERVEHLSGPYQSRVILHHGNGSPASIVSRVLLEETAGKIILMDADQQAPDEILPAMLSCLESNDLVVASSASSPNRSRRPEKRLTVRIANWLALPLAPNVRDRMSGSLGFRRALLEPTSLNAGAASIGLEIIAQGHFKSAAHIDYTPTANTIALSSIPRPGAWAYLTQIVRLYLSRFQILNFMVVGGIGYAINMAIYYPLTLLFHSTTVVFGQQYYLPPFVVSTLIAICSNYYLNKKWTFGDSREASFGFGRYLLMGAVTGLGDMALLFAFVRYLKMFPQLAAAIAILIVFVVRFFIAKTMIWGKRKGASLEAER